MAYSKNRRLAEIVSDTSGNLSVEGIIVPTQSSSDNDTSAASTAFVHAHIDAVLDSAPGTLNTLNEIAAALNDDANFNTTVTNAIAAKLPLAGGTMTGALTLSGAPTNALHPATKTYTDTADALKLNLSGGSLTGNITLTTSNTKLQLKSTGSGDSELYFQTASNGRGIYLDQSDANKLKIYDGSGKGTAGEVVIDNSGNVGIGTASPSTKLTVRNDSATTSFGDNNIITLQNANTTDNSRIGLAFTGNTGIGSGLAVIDAVSYDQSAGHTSLNFSVYNGSWHNDMMVLKAGDVLIGSSTNLNVLSGTPKIQVGSGTGHSSMQFYSGNGSVGAIYFGDASSGGDRYPGYIEYRHNNNTMALRAAGTDQVVIGTNETKFTGRVELSNGKPIFSETDNGTHQYSHLCTGSFYSGSNQGVAINTNIPSHNVSGNNMFMITIKGFAYEASGGGIIDCNIGMYSGEGGFHNATYSGSNIPKQWLEKIRVGYTSANKVIILLGDIDTTTNYEIAVSCGVQGFYGVNPDYFTGWTTSAFTSLSSYTGVVNIPPKETTMIGFEAYTTSMSKAAGWHIISNSMSTEAYDHGGFYDTSTGKFQPTVAGMYMFSCGGYSGYNSGSSGQHRYAFALSKNGSLSKITGGNYSDQDSPLAGMSYVEYLNGGSDYVVLSMYSAVAVTLGHPSHPIWWQAHLINAGPGGSATSWTI